MPIWLPNRLRLSVFGDGPAGVLCPTGRLLVLLQWWLTLPKLLLSVRLGVDPVGDIGNSGRAGLGGGGSSSEPFEPAVKIKESVKIKIPLFY